MFKLNSFREKNLFILDNEKKNSIDCLNKDSLLLKKIIENKIKERKSIKKVFENKKNIGDSYQNRVQKSEKILNKNAENRYASPINIKEKENKSNKENNKSNYCNDRLNSKSNTSRFQSKNNSFFFYKIPNYFTHRTSNSIKNFQNKSYTFNKDNNESENESTYLSLNGKKIFATSTFTGLNNKTFSNTTNGMNSELFRNYYELKRKKEEIFNRKIKKSNSLEKREILNIQKNKEIKEQTLEIELKKNNSANFKKIKKIPVRKNYIIKNIYQTNAKEKEYIIKNTNSLSMNSRNKLNNSYKNINQRENYENLYISRDKNNKNKILLDKKIKEITIPNNFNFNNSLKKIEDYKIKINSTNIINKKEINVSINNIRQNNEKENNANFNYKYNSIKKVLTPDRFKYFKKIIPSKKKFIEDQLNEFLFISKDQKLMIKIHSLKNMNQIFQLKRKNKLKLKKQKILTVFLTNKFKFYLNYLKCYNKPIKYKRYKKKNYLNSIKEEEEKSKNELTKSESKIEEKEKNIFDKNNKSKKISDLKKVIFIN